MQYLVTNDVIGPNVYTSFPATPEGLKDAMRWAEQLLGQEIVYEAEGPLGVVRNCGACRSAQIWELTGRRRRLLYTFRDGLTQEALIRSRPSGLAAGLERLVA